MTAIRAIFRFQQIIEGQDLLTDGWPRIHLSSDRGEQSSSQFRSDMWLAENYRPSPGDRTGTASLNTSSKLYALNLSGEDGSSCFNPWMMNNILDVVNINLISSIPCAILEGI